MQAVPLALLALLRAQESRPALEEGFESPFNGKDLIGWIGHYQFVSDRSLEEIARADRDFRVEDGEIACSGMGKGWLGPAKVFRHFTLRFEWRYQRPLGLVKDESKFPGDSGVLLFVNETDKIWPKSLAVEGSFREVGAIKPMGITAAVKNDADARRKARKPLAEWNETEIAVKGDKVTVRLNGTVVATASGLTAKAGYIAFQDEGDKLRWRNVRIREEKP